MNIIDAIRSGKKYRRQGITSYATYTIFSIKDILADDWEVEEETFEVTDTIFYKVYNKWRDERGFIGETNGAQLLRLLKEESKNG